eukprot:11223150-Lingulodinium_polyedra.AAC.1
MGARHRLRSCGRPGPSSTRKRCCRRAPATRWRTSPLRPTSLTLAVAASGSSGHSATSRTAQL